MLLAYNLVGRGEEKLIKKPYLLFDPLHFNVVKTTNKRTLRLKIRAL